MERLTRRLVIALAVSLGAMHSALPQSATAASRPVVIASKPFGESYLLAEMFAQLLEARGMRVERRPGLGATEVAFAALRSGAIDVYPEYTGTGLTAILHASPEHDARRTFAIVQREFATRWGIRWLPPLGFQNTYAIAVRRRMADSLHLATLTDLARASRTLRAGLTPDFIGRPDGLPGLVRAYGIAFRDVRPLAPALKYQALAAGGVDVVDGYSTDGLIERYRLTVLTDDKQFFPPYEAAALVSARVQRSDPAAVAVLTELSGRLDVDQMRRANARVEVNREAIASVAGDVLRDLGLVRSANASRPSASSASTSLVAFLSARRHELASQTLRHIELVALSLVAAILVGLPLGLMLERAPRLAEGTIRVAATIETIPSIALLAFMVPLIGVGVWPALVALWLYGLYPVVRNAYSGVRDADPAAAHAARALGMTDAQVLRHVRTPLAAGTILAGVRTAAVLSVGTATLAAFIGAGGLGEPIATGLALADTRLILSGAIPAALLALIVDGLLALVERALTPAPLRRRA